MAKKRRSWIAKLIWPQPAHREHPRVRGFRNLTVERLEARAMLDGAPVIDLSDLLAKMTPDPHPSGDMPADTSQITPLATYTPREVPPDMPGIPEIHQFVVGLEQVHADIQGNQAARPAAWGENMAATGYDYRVHLDDNGMLVSQWTINWGDGSDPQTVGAQPWVVHTFPGPGTYDIQVSAASSDGTYAFDSTGVLSAPDIVATLQPVSPVGHVTDDPTVFVNQSFSLANVAAFTVPNPGAGQTTNVLYTINWADGSSESHELSLAGDASGVPVVNGLSDTHTFHSIPADPTTPYQVSISVYLCDADWNPQPQAFSQQSIPYYVVAAPPVESSITTTTSDPVDAQSVTFQVQFSAPVTRVTSADFVVAGDGVTGTVEPVAAGPANSSGYYTTCTVTVDNIAFTAGTGNGTLGLDLVDNNSIVDANGDPLGGPALGDGAVTGPVYTIDNHLYYDATVGGAWNATNENWRIGGVAGPLTTWVPYSQAIVSGSSTSIAITTGQSIAASSLTFLGNGDSLSGGTVNFGLTGGAIDVEGTSAAVSSTIVGAAVAKAGPGPLALTANDADQTEIDQGAIQASGPAGLGTGPIVINAGILEATEAFTWAGPIIVNSSRSAIQADTGTLTLTGPLSSNGTVAVVGVGTAKLSGDLNGLSGPVNVQSTLDLETPLASPLSVSAGGHVIGADTPLSATISGPAGGAVSAPLVFTASATDAIAASPSNLTFTWQVLNSANTVVASGTGSSFTYTPTSNGTYTLSLAASDDDATSQAVTQPLIVDSAPTVATAATAADTTVEGTSTVLSALGADANGEPGLTYTWTFTKSGGADDPVFFVNGTNSAKVTEVSFTTPGSYDFTATITNALGETATSSVSVTVASSLTTIAVSGPSSILPEGAEEYTATAYNQFGTTLATQPSFTWYLAGGDGTLSSGGLYTAPSTATTATLVATSATVSGFARVNVSSTTLAVATAAAAVPATVDGTTTNLSVLGADTNGEADLTYSWQATDVPTGATAPAFSANGSNAAKDTTATFSMAGSYTFEVTVTDSSGNSTTSDVSVTVDQTLDAIQITPASPTVAVDGSVQLTGTAVDQFGNAISGATVDWQAMVAGTNVVSSSGLVSAPDSPMTVTVVATSGALSQSTAVAVTDSPTAMFALGNGGPTPLGNAATVSFAVADGLNLPDTAGPFTYSFDFGNTGTFEISGSASPTATVPASYLAQAGGSLTVRGRVQDSLGSTDYTTSIPVIGVAPALDPIGGRTVAAGASLTVSPTFSAVVATSTTYSYALDWGDGSVSTGTPSFDATAAPGTIGAGSFGGSHTYTQQGQFTVYALVSDSLGDRDIETFTVEVTQPQAAYNVSGTTSATAGTAYTLNLVAAGNGTASLQSWTIDWGDATPPQQVPGGIAAVEHVYSDLGAVIISATASDGQSTFNAGSLPVQVGLGDDAISGSAAAAAGVAYTLNLTVASGEPTPDHWTIDWGDDSDEQEVSGGSQQVTHTFASAGSVGILATVTDSVSTRDAGMIGVTVSGTTPTAPSPAPSSPMTYALTGLDVSAATGPNEYEITGTVVDANGVPMSDALVQLDLDGSGAAERTTRTDDAGNFSYTYTPASASEQTVKAQVVEWNASDNAWHTGPWVSTTYTPTLDATVSDIELTTSAETSGDNQVTADPTLWGLIDATGIDFTNCVVSFVVGGDADTLQTVPVNAGGQFYYTLQGLASSTSPITVSANVSWTDPATGLQIQGTATDFTFIYYVPPQAPSLASLELAASTDPSGVIAGTDPTIAGALDPNAPVLSSVSVEVSLSSDFSDADTVTTDTDGNFSDTLSSLSSSSSPVTVYARSAVVNAVDSTTSYGPTRSFTFTCYTPQAAPEVTSFTVPGGTTTSDPSLIGQVATSGGSFTSATIQFALSENGSDVIGSTTVDYLGQFTFVPTTLTPGAAPLTVYARSSLYDATTNSYQYSAWQSATFTYTRADYEIPTVTTLAVSHPTGDTNGDGDPIVTDPTINGQVKDNLGSPVPYVTVDIDTTGGSQADAQVTTDASGNFSYTPDSLPTGDNTIAAWVHGYDYTQAAFVDGTAKPLTLDYEPVAPEAPTIQNLRLLSQTGTDGSSLPTAANLTIAGNIDSATANVAVQYRVEGSGTNLGTVLTDDNGDFSFVPTGLATGPVTIQARALAWNESLGEYLVGDWQDLALDNQPAATTAAALVDLAVANPVATVSCVTYATDPTVTGHVKVLDSGSLAGVTVQISTSDTGSPEQSTTTDAQGAFSFSMAGLDYGGQTLYVRTIRYDANSGQAFTSDWTTTDVSPLTFDYIATPSLASVSEVYASGTNAVNVVGQVNSNPAMSNISVEFDTDGDGTSNYSESVDAGDGTFSYAPYAFDPSQQMQVRLQQDLGSGNYIYSAWQTVSPPSDAPSYAVNISQLTLTNTGAAVNGATDDRSVSGQITASGDLSGYTVEFDTNGDGSPDTSVETDSDGNFVLPTPSVSYGLTTIAARVSQGGSSYGGWTYLRFYYTVDPSSSESQTVVAALSQQDPTWQSDATGVRAAGLSSSDIQNSAQAANDAAAAALEALENSMAGQAANAQQSALQTSDSQYASDMAAAASQYASDLTAYTGDPTTESLPVFAWPTAPNDNAAVLGGGNAPPAPSYDGPAFNSNPSSGPLHDALAAAQTAYNSAVTAATTAYNSAKSYAQSAYNAAQTTAASDLLAVTDPSTGSAIIAYNNAVNSPAITPSLSQINSDLTAVTDPYTGSAVTTYNTVAGFHGSNWSKYEDPSNPDSATAKAIAAYNAAKATAHAKWLPGGTPTYAQQQGYLDDVAAALLVEQKAFAQNDHDYAYAQTAAAATYHNALAAAQQKAAQATAVYNRKLADITVQAAQTKAKNDADAQRVYDKAIDAAQHALSVALAQAADTQSIALATAQANLLQAQAAAEKQAVDVWSAASGRTPWTEYQAALADDASAYYVAARPLIISHATSLANDAKTEADALADHLQTQADATADANYYQTTQTADALASYALSTDQAAQTRDEALATSALTLQTTWNAQQKVVNQAIADSAKTYDLSVATALYTMTVADDLASYQNQTSVLTFNQWGITVANNNYIDHTAIINAAEVQGLAQNEAEHKSSTINNAAIATNLTATATAQDTYGEAAAGFGKTRDLALAGAAKSYADSIATAAATQTKADATSISRLNAATAKDDGTYIIAIAGAAETWTIADANAQASFQTAVATDYDNLVIQWNLSVGTPWSAYQKALADSQASYVAGMSAAVTAEVTAIAQQQFAETQQTIAAQESYAAQFAGEQSTLGNAVAAAVQSQASDVAQAVYADAQSAATATAKQGTAKSQALGAYQKAVAAARKTEANAMDDAEYTDDRTDIPYHATTGLDYDQAEIDYNNGTIDGDTLDAEISASVDETDDLTNAAGTAANGSEATAFQTAATAVTAAHETWIDAQADADTALTHSITTATQTLATAINDATSRAADSKRQAETTYGANTAKDVETLSKTTADAQRSYAIAIAGAETAYNTTSDSAASALREQAASAADYYALAIYTNHAVAMADAADELDDPLISYQAATAAADQTYMTYALTADTAYQETITIADALQTERLNEAETKYAQAQADAAYNEAVQTAAAVRAQTTAVSAANARQTYLDTVANAQQAAANLNALAAYQDSRTKAESTFLKAAASADTTWMSAWVGADVQRMSDIDGGTDETTADDTRADTEDSADDTLQDTTDSLNATRLGSVGDAQIALATAEGNTAVARAKGYGQADVSWADAVASADTALANATASAHVAAVTSSSSATTQYEEDFSTAMTESNEISGPAAVDYQALLGAAFVIRANSRAIADAAYQSAVADAQAVSSEALADPNLPFEDRAVTAYAAWIDAMGGPYIAYATATAQAEANYENATTVAATQNVSTSATTPDDSVALAEAMAAYTSQDAALQAAQLRALAQTEADHTLAQANASKTLAIAEATYQKTYETGLSATDAADNTKTSATQDDTDADQDYTISLAQADETWSDGVLAAQQDLTVGEASAQATLATTSASTDEENAQAVAEQYAGDEETLAHAQVSSWDAATTAGNAWNTASTLAQVAFVSAGYSAQTTAIAGLVSAMPSGAAGKDWAQFRADLASAQETWWDSFSPTIMTNTYLANLSATAYQFQVDTTYLSASTSAAEADAAYIVAQAQSQDNQIAADARANRALAISTANATYDGSAATADDLEQYQESQARGDDAYTHSDMDDDDADAGATYTLAIANADATNAIAIAQDQADATTTAAESTAAWTQAQDAATLAVTVAESQAYAAQQMNLASLTVSTYTQMGDSYATAAADFATASPSPWANQEAASATAAATSNDAALLAWLANQKSTIAANSQAEIGAAKADAVLADQSAASVRASALAGAAQALATVRATQLASLAETQYDPAGGAPSAPSAPNLILPDKTPGIDPAYSITRAAASDYNLSTAAASAHSELVHAVYADPWTGWWTGTSTSKVNFGTAHSTSVYNGLGAFRLDAANEVSGYFIATDGDGNYINLTIDGPWHGGWNDGAVQGIFIHGISVVDPSSQAFTTFINAHAPQPQGSFAVKAVSIIVGIGVGVLTAEFGPIIAGAASMAAMNATSALFNGVLAGQSAEQIAYNVFVSAGIGALAGAAGGAAGALMKPIAAGLAGTLGLTCENGLGAFGAFVIGGTDGAAFGATSNFVQVAISTNDFHQALDAAGQGALFGGLIGGAIGVGMNAIDPFICFTAKTPVQKQFTNGTAESEGLMRRVMTTGTLATAHLPGDDPTNVDPANCRRVHLRTSKPFGSDNILDAELVRPLAWFDANGVVVGRKIRFCVPELEIDAPADVVEVGACPKIEPGRGRVITGKFTTAKCRVMQIRVSGETEPLEPTPPHRFYSLDRGDYIPASELRTGERLQTRSGEIVTVESVGMKPGLHRVFNFEVEGDHNFFVGECGVLVHNAYSEGRFSDGIDPVIGTSYAESVRTSLNIEGRNLALAEVVLEGEPRQLLVGVSGAESPVGTVPVTDSAIFTTTPSGAMTRSLDSEVKLLEDIAKGLTPGARGTIALFSERTPCYSCRNVIEQFRDLFPNINVIVTNGGL